MKFIKHHMATIDGVGVFPLISLLICFALFIVLLWWVFTYENKDINEMSNIPLEEDNNNDLL